MNRHRFSGLLALAIAASSAAPLRADFTNTYNGHTYVVVTTTRNWDSAQTDAVVRGGVLARIEDDAENAALLSMLTNRGITATAPDGGGSVYVWIGGRETTEGTYVWTNRGGTATAFWTGGRFGSATNGLYANWGRGTNGTAGPEPDNFNSTQNRAGFALEPWPRSGTNKIGQAGQWNDINGTDALAYVVERTPPNLPSNFTAVVTSPTNLNLVWRDASADELGFHIWFHQGTEGNFSFVGSLPANSTNVPLSGLAVTTTYQFAIASYNDVGFSNPPVVTTVTMPGVIGRGFQPAVVGQAFSYTVTVSSNGTAPDSYSVTGALPPGLSFNAGTHQITGTPTSGGVFTVTQAVHYPVWGDFSKPLTLRVIYPPGPPVATAAIPRQALVTAGPAVTVPLNQFFADRDTEKAARFATSKGNFDIALYATATPQTVSNFLGYVNRGDYSNSIIHRAMTNFVIQGGGYRPAPTNFTRIPTGPSPTNEPGVQHVRGTLAMAKLGNNPNSATDEWFINLKDNSAELDDQNSGFTAFARICGNGLAVADAIIALPTGSYTLNVDGLTSPFSDWPMDTAPPAPPVMDLSRLVLVNSVTQIEPLTYSVTGTSVSGLVASAIVGTNLVLTPAGLFGGTTVVTVAATDLDGTSYSQAVTVAVASAYSDWLGQYSLTGTNAMPGADSESDGLPNVTEFALAGSPVASDAANTLPTGSLVTAGGQPHGALIFRLRKSLGGVTVVVMSSSILAAGGWTPVWTSADLGSPLVLEREDRGDHWRMKVRDATPLSPGASQRFLRLVVNLPP